MRKYAIHIGLVLLICGFSLLFVDHVSANIKSYYTDVEKSKEIIKNVNMQYIDFKDVATSVKDDIFETATYLNGYLSDFTEYKDEVKEKIVGVESKIESLNDVSNKILNDCSVGIEDDNMNNICKTFKTNYKNMINSFKEMVNQYNDFVSAYNQYANSSNLENIDTYNSKIDIMVRDIVNKIV